MEEFLLAKAQRVAHQLQDQQQVGVLLWDESVVEKPESIHSEGLCAVRSSKAKRLKRIKPGFYNPPGGRPVHVPGFEWMSLLLAIGFTSAKPLFPSATHTGSRFTGLLRNKLKVREHQQTVKTDVLLMVRLGCCTKCVRVNNCEPLHKA